MLFFKVLRRMMQSRSCESCRSAERGVAESEWRRPTLVAPPRSGGVLTYHAALPAMEERSRVAAGVIGLDDLPLRLGLHAPGAGRRGAAARAAGTTRLGAAAAAGGVRGVAVAVDEAAVHVAGAQAVDPDGVPVLLDAVGDGDAHAFLAADAVEHVELVVAALLPRDDRLAELPAVVEQPLDGAHELARLALVRRVEHVRPDDDVDRSVRLLDALDALLLAPGQLLDLYVGRAERGAVSVDILLEQVEDLGRVARRHLLHGAVHRHEDGGLGHAAVREHDALRPESRRREAHEARAGADLHHAAAGDGGAAVLAEPVTEHGRRVPDDRAGEVSLLEGHGGAHVLRDAQHAARATDVVGGELLAVEAHGHLLLLVGKTRLLDGGRLGLRLGLRRRVRRGAETERRPVEAAASRRRAAARRGR
mmetsp:Transcript_37791/g.118332  ORF Transcript_37791/g.118332 Transcript_37791/m.118332 type:complete len:421 (-) Transcript_37791:305-1567(-)